MAASNSNNTKQSYPFLNSIKDGVTRNAMSLVWNKLNALQGVDVAGPFRAPLDHGSNKGINCADPEDPQDVVTLAYLNQKIEELSASLGNRNAVSSSSGGGDVFGPNIAVNNDIAVFDGTTGKLIKDGGTTIASIINQITIGGSPLATNGLQFVTFNGVPVDSLNSSPLTIVGSGAPNFMIWPVYAALAVTQSVAYGASPTFRWRYSGFATDILTPTTSDLANNRNKVYQFVPANQQFFGANVTNVNSKSFELSLSADPTGGVATVAGAMVFQRVVCPP